MYMVNFVSFQDYYTKIKKNEMIKYLIIGLGGAIGSIARVITSDVLPLKISENFPLQILIVNILGCF